MQHLCGTIHVLVGNVLNDFYQPEMNVPHCTGEVLILPTGGGVIFIADSIAMPEVPSTNLRPAC